MMGHEMSDDEMPRTLDGTRASAPIPEDIVATATGLCVEWAKSSDGANHLMAAIAAALLAERQRCASLLASLDFEHCEWGDVIERIEVVARAIAEGAKP